MENANIIFSFAGINFTYEWLGWLGSMLFAFCGLPQAIHAFRHKHADGMTWSFIMMWLWGKFLLSFIFLQNKTLFLFWQTIF